MGKNELCALSKKKLDELINWIIESENTNQYCKRTILVEAICLLGMFPFPDDNPKIRLAFNRLLELTPINGSQLIEPPIVAKMLETEINKIT